MSTELCIGVLALQGDFERHLYRLASLNIPGREVRRSSDLNDLNGLIIPGGESTTISRLLDRFSMREELTLFAKDHAVWGTCAGMIMLAGEVDDSSVHPLGIINISVIRNGYGRQVHSFFTEIAVKLNGCLINLPASFIRAPMVSRAGDDVSVLASYEDSPVLLSQRNCLVSSFHSELDNDLSLLKFFIERFVSSSDQYKSKE